MNTPASTTKAPLDLTVRFIGGALIDEEVVHWVRACAQKRAADGPLTVVLQRTPGAHSKMYEVRLERPDRVLLTEQDPNVMLAVRNAFDRFAMTPAWMQRPRASA